MSLVTLAEQIKTNLADAETSKLDYMWQRAGLYAQARQHFTSDKLFGQWIAEEFKSTACGRVDSSNTVRKLIACLEMFTEQQFLDLGYSRAVEFVVKSTWSKYRDVWDSLVQSAITNEMSRDAIREAMRAIKEQATPVIPERELSRIEVLEARLAVKDNEYVDGIRFFSNHPEILKEQLKQLKSNERYCCMLFEVNRSDIAGLDVTAVKARKRYLARVYHPDKPTGSVRALISARISPCSLRLRRIDDSVIAIHDK